MRGWCLKKNGGTENQALGRSRGGFSTKIHVTVDALGNPLRMLITPGQRNDIVEAEALIIGYDSEHVIGDKGYDSNDFIDVIEANCGYRLEAIVSTKEHTTNIYTKKDI